MKNLLILFSAIVTGLNAYSQNSPGSRQRLPIIDMHMHTGLPHEVPAGVPSLCRPEPCEGDGHAVISAELMEKTLAAMDRYNITKAFLSGVDLSAVREWTAADPDR